MKAARPRVATSQGPIRFGTSGWRGILADEITAPRLRALAGAVARWSAAETQRVPVVLVAHDTRFLGASLARLAVDALAANGARPLLAPSPVPTPVVAHAVRWGAADVALIVTASHNAPAYQGVKVVAGWGGGVTAEQAHRIEQLAATEQDAPEPAPGACSSSDLVAPYLKNLAGLIDRAAIRAAPPAVLYDAHPRHGLRRLRSRCCARSARASRCSTPRRIAALRRRRAGSLAGATRRAREAPCAHAADASLGLATDGDGDRYAVLDSERQRCSRRARRWRCWSITSRAAAARGAASRSRSPRERWSRRVAAEHGLPVERHPIGFKHLSRALAEGRADVAGEESGGFAWDPIARDKDGILACALFTEIAACGGGSLRARLQQLVRKHGRRRCGACRARRDRARARATRRARRGAAGTCRRGARARRRYPRRRSTRPSPTAS